MARECRRSGHRAADRATRGRDVLRYPPRTPVETLVYGWVWHARIATPSRLLGFWLSAVGWWKPDSPRDTAHGRRTDGGNGLSAPAPLRSCQAGRHGAMPQRAPRRSTAGVRGPLAHCQGSDFSGWVWPPVVRWTAQAICLVPVPRVSAPFGFRPASAGGVRERRPNPDGTSDLLLLDYRYRKRPRFQGRRSASIAS